MKNVRVVYLPRSRPDNIEKKPYTVCLRTRVIIIHNFSCSQEIISNFALSDHYPKVPRLIIFLVSRDDTIKHR